ncbi:MAG: hypothetical protein KBT00_06305 [Bacteroidales bacterium]|nr:hypothetical protein [Candidatus Cacconaster merdequi]
MMNKIRQYIQLAALVVSVCLSACTKEAEEEESTSKSMKGYLHNDIPSFVFRNDYVTVTAYGITDPAEPQYKWYASGISDTLSAATVTIHFPDSLGTFTVTDFSSYTGYYTSSNSRDVATVDTTFNTSLKNVVRSGKSFLDKRDNKHYSYETIGNLDWFTQNLAYSGAGAPYMGSPVTGFFFGYYYSWNEATGGISAEGLGCGPQGVCPEGWCIPTNEDWEDLAMAMNGGEPLAFSDKWQGLGSKASANATFMGIDMWNYSNETEHTNDFGWNALPTGNTSNNHSDINGFDSYGFWWSATQKNDKQAYYRYIFYDYDNFPMNYTAKEDFGASIRCVRVAQ